jgi:hypothetical protein
MVRFNNHLLILAQLNTNTLTVLSLFFFVAIRTHVESIDLTHGWGQMVDQSGTKNNDFKLSDSLIVPVKWHSDGVFQISLVNLRTI